MKFICKKCDKTKELMRATLEVVDGKVRTREAQCKCGEYMQEIEKEFTGFPTIHRNEYTKEDRIIQHKGKQKEARLKREGYDKHNPNDKPPKKRRK